jgi:hypothetical protein
MGAPALSCAADRASHAIVIDAALTLIADFDVDGIGTRSLTGES